MGREYDVLDIARYIINKCNEKGIIISNLKLQKLLEKINEDLLELELAINKSNNESTITIA